MVPAKNIPLLMNLAYAGYNRGLDGDFKPIKHIDGSLTTFCNEFIKFICSGFGYSDFNGKMANEMVLFMMDAKNGWIALGDEVAQHHANNGVIVIAGRINPLGHGHVALIVPGILEKSNSFGKAVPKCVNIGKDVFFGKRISLAFTATEAPSYFALSGMI